MRLLLDTHLLLWWLAADPRLPAAVVDLVQTPGAEVFVSQASLWELAIKHSLGKVQVDLANLEWQLPQLGFQWLAIQNAHLLAVAQLECDPYHRDPFDRLLAAQAELEGVSLVSLDRALAAFPCRLLW